MRKYIFIGMGGFLGAAARFAVKNIHIYHYHGNIPLNTLIINVSGSFILALLLTIAFEIFSIDTDIRLGIATGFLGAYTTFSTLCRETVSLMMDGHYYSAVSYVIISTVLGIAAVYLGVLLARGVFAKFKASEAEDAMKDFTETEGEAE